MKKYIPNFQQLDKLTEDGYLNKVFSPCNKLVLYNYTDKCTYEKKWNEHTLNARGTVYEVSTGKIIARAFKKFFNFSELSASEQRNLIKRTDFIATEKYDGSMGLVFWYDDRWWVTTRGSFTSDQAIRATEILKKYDMSYIDTNINLVVEIIYPENRIIVNYGAEEKLVLLNAYNNHLNEDLFSSKSHRQYIDVRAMGIESAAIHHFTSIDRIIEKQSELSNMEEGFVVRFNDERMVKFKSLEYLKTARIVSNMTPLNFWKNMKNGIVKDEILSQIPEEFRKEADKISYQLADRYQKTLEEINSDYAWVILIVGCQDVSQTRKELGLYLRNNPKELKHPAAMFPMLIDGNVDDYIMKIIRPKSNRIGGYCAN
jgi:hypothetical protein